MSTAITNNDFQSLLPDGSEGWLIKKGTKIQVLEVDKNGVLCDYIDYTFYCDGEYLDEVI